MITAAVFFWRFDGLKRWKFGKDMGHILANTLSKMPRTLYSILLFIANWLVAIV